jgi:type II secretory pathway pseudopilin PulG
MELVVVMVILVALAGMVIPLFPNLIGRAQTSAGATNLGEVAKAVQMYYNLNGNRYPYNLDSIVDAAGAIPSYVPNPTSAPAGYGGNTSSTPDLAPYTLSSTTNDFTALANAFNTNPSTGTITLAQMIDAPASSAGTDWNPTFFPYGTSAAAGATFSALSNTSTVAVLNAAAANRVFGVPSTGIGTQQPTYVVFGLGKYSAMSGNSMTDSPVLFNTASGYDPNTVYARVGLVFQTADASGSLTTAKFIGAIEFSQYGVRTVGNDLQLNYSMK